MLRNKLSNRNPDQIFSMTWLPILVGVFLSILVGLFSWVLYTQDQADFQKKVDSENSKIAASIDSDLRSRVSALQRLAKYWEIHGGLTEAEFTSDVQGMVNDMPGFQAVEWVDQAYIVRWIVPMAGNEKAKNLNLAFEEKRRLALEGARVNDSPTMSASVDLVQGGKGFLIYFPVYINGDFNGFILAVFRVEEWLSYVLDSQQDNINHDGVLSSLLIDEVEVFQQPGWQELIQSATRSTSTINMLSHRLSVVSRPTASFVKNNTSYLPVLSMAIGLLLALLVGMLVQVFQKATTEAVYSSRTKAALELEVEGHEQTTNELQQALSRLDMATKAGGIGVWSWNIATNALTWNERMYQLYNLSVNVDLVYDTWRNRLHPDDLQRVENLLTSAVQGKDVFNTEFRILLPGKETRYMGAAARVQHNTTGVPIQVTGINWDLTDLKKAELTLRTSEEQVRLLLNSTAEAIYGIDMKGLCTFANPSCLRLLGYSDTKDLLGKDMHLLIHHSYIDGSAIPVEECLIRRTLRDGEGLHRDNEIFWRAGGTYFPVEYWSYPQFVDGVVIGTVVTFIDITERKQSEKLLAFERRRLSNILEGTNVGTWEWNVQTGVTVFNERWANIMGYTLSDLSPVSIETWRQLCHPEDSKLSDELLEKHFRRETDYYDCEVRMRHKNGGWIWVLDRGRIASWTEDGKPLLMSGTHQDITERKVIEDYLRLSEAQNRALLDAIPDLILRIHRDGTILDYKASSNDLLVVSPDRIVGSVVDQVLDSTRSEPAMECIEAALSTGQVQKMEFSQVIRDAQVTFEARFKNSAVDEVIAIVRDISEQARLEQMKSDFINRATHELRTPIATMLLMSNLIEGEPGFNPENEYWIVLKSELNRERMLVEDLLTAGRLESDRTHFHFRIVDLMDVLRRVVQSLELAARENHIEISLEAGNGIDEKYCPVSGDDNALTQVFVNLVGNAIKFSPAGGKVSIVASKNSSGVEISINDNGIGIPPEDLPMLFSRFFRGTNAIESEIQGTGIGLFIVRSILDKHNGKVRAISELGKGSQFIVWIPEGA